MSQIIIEDAGWRAIMADERLRGARSKLSFHELRLIIGHARASVDTHPKDGNSTEIEVPLVSGAVPNGETPSPSHRSTGE